MSKDNGLLSPGERIKIYEKWKKEHPDDEPNCEFSFLNMMLKAQRAKDEAEFKRLSLRV